MKNLFIIALILFTASNSAFASPQNSNCLDEMTKTLHTVTHPSYLLLVVSPFLAAGAFVAAHETRDAILANLDAYEDLVKTIRANILHDISNRDNYIMIKRSLRFHENDAVLGLPVGKEVVSCVRPLLNFNGSRSEQIMQTHEAFMRIASIRRAVE